MMPCEVFRTLKGKYISGVLVFFMLGVFWGMPQGLSADWRSEINIIEDPVPTCEESVYVELKKIASVTDELDSPAFLVYPWSIAADADGNIYVMDAMFRKIYKYNKNLVLLKTFGGKGEGPGEFSDKTGMGTSFIEIYLGRDNNLYAGDRFARKIICYDREGKLVKETRMNVKPFAFINPVVDSKGNYYFNAKYTYIIDAFNPKGERICGYLPRKLLANGLFYKLKSPYNQKGFYYDSHFTTVDYDFIRDDRLLVFFKASGFLYIIKGDKVEKKLKLWPKKLLGIHKKELKFSIADMNANDEGFFPFFNKMIVDRDNEKYLYFCYGKPMGDNKTYIYQFDLEGRLVKVLYFKEPFEQAYSKVLYKRNGLFYGIGYDNDESKTLIILKEEKSN